VSVGQAFKKADIEAASAKSKKTLCDNLSAAETAIRDKYRDIRELLPAIRELPTRES
jgi:hypothetical protein